MATKERQIITKRFTNNVASNVDAAASALGGYTVPDAMMLGVKSAMKNYTGLMQSATVLFTDNGRPLPVPYALDTGNVGELVAEEGAVATKEYTFGQIVLGGWKFSSKIVRVSREFLQDSVINPNEFIGRTLGERIIRNAATYFITGTGTNQPKGLRHIVDVNNVVALNAPATFDSYSQFQTFRHTLDPAHRAAPGCAYLCNNTALKNLLSLVDISGRSLLQPNLNGPRFHGSSKADWVIYGQPLYVDSNCYSGAADPEPFMYYGDLSKFIIRIAIDVQPMRLNELYAANGQVGFVAFARIDSNLPLLVPSPIVSARYDN